MWKLLVGIKDALVLLLMLFFFGMVYAGLSAKPAPVRDGVLDLSLKGSLVEQPARADWSDLAGAPRLDQYRLRDLVAALHEAKTDRRVKAVALDLDGFTGGGQTAIGDLADAVRAVRASGKSVVAYGVGYTDDSYQLASAASEVWLNPMGAVLIAGPGGSNLYYKGLLDKLGVTANVYRVGTYKSAVEPFIRNDMSPAAKENYLALDQAVLETWRQSVKQARPKANVDLFLKDMNGAVAAAGGDMAKAALNAGLIDRIGERSAFEARLAQLGGKSGSEDGSFKRIKLGSYVADVVEDDSTGPIGVVTVAGMIVDGNANPGTAGGDTIAKAIKAGVHDGIKALVVRVDILPVRMYSRQASVWMVKPGGTGRPALVISARPAPLPPRTSFILPLPSARPAPKENTYFVPVCGAVAIVTSVCVESCRARYCSGHLWRGLRVRRACRTSTTKQHQQPQGPCGPLRLDRYRRYFLSVTISEKSAIVVNSLTSVWSRARRRVRTFSSSTITITLSKKASTTGRNREISTSAGS
jgi:ClpP class serine protease